MIFISNELCPVMSLRHFDFLFKKIFMKINHFLFILVFFKNVCNGEKIKGNYLKKN